MVGILKEEKTRGQLFILDRWIYRKFEPGKRYI